MPSSLLRPGTKIYWPGTNKVSIGFSIDFYSQMIVSMIDIYQDTATGDKLIFPSVITCILTHMHIPIPPAPLSSIVGAISEGFIWRSDA